MDESFIIIVVVVVIAIAVITFLVKSAMKFVVIAALIYLLFHLGFIWGVDDLNTKLGLNRFLKPEANQAVQEVYGNFTNKRDEYGMVNTKEVKKVIDDTLAKAVTEGKTQLTQIDRQRLVEELKAKLDQYDDQAVEEALNASKDALRKLLTEKDVNEITPTP